MGKISSLFLPFLLIDLRWCVSITKKKGSLHHSPCQAPWIIHTVLIATSNLSHQALIYFLQYARPSILALRHGSREETYKIRSSIITINFYVKGPQRRLLYILTFLWVPTWHLPPKGCLYLLLNKLFHSYYVTVQLDLPIHRQIDSSNNSNGCYILERCYSWSECCITDLEAEVAKLSLKRSRSMSHVNGKLYGSIRVQLQP